jgi:hypothetical protein
MTPKIKRRWIKEEKRIVYLLYIKGLLKDFKVSDFYWAEYHWYRKKCYKTKKNKYDGKRYRFPVYMPEIHYCTTDYWGESDEHSIVSHVLDMLHWEHVDMDNWDDTSGEWPKSTFKKMNRSQFIHYLKKLPTVVSDNKINKLLKKCSYDE